MKAPRHKFWPSLLLLLSCAAAPAETFDSDFSDAAETFKVDNSRLSEPGFKIRYEKPKLDGVKENSVKSAVGVPVPVWKPEWTFFGVGGPALPCARGSEAAGLLAVAETTKDNGSRIAFLDLATGQPRSVAELPGRLVDRLAFSPDGAELFYCSQPRSGVPARLGVLDVAKAKDAQAPVVLKSAAAALATNGRQVFVKPAPDSDDKRLLVFDAKDLSRGPKQVDCDNLGGALAVSPDGVAALVVGDAGAELVDTLLLRKRGGFALPPGYVPDHVLALPDTSSPEGGTSDVAAKAQWALGVRGAAAPAGAWLLSAKGRPAYLVRDGKLTELTPFSSGTAGLNEAARTLLVESGKNNAVLLFESSSGKPLGEFVPSKTRPATRRPALLFCGQPSTGKHLALDDFGNLAAYRLDGKKWRKELLFQGAK